MIQNQCFQMPFNHEQSMPDFRKIYTEPSNYADSHQKKEQAPLKDSSYQNKTNLKTKIVKLKCVSKANTCKESRIDVKEVIVKHTTQKSRDKIEKTFCKKERQPLCKLRKNVMKTIVYKSNSATQEQIRSQGSSKLHHTYLIPRSRETSVSFNQGKKTGKTMSLQKKDGSKTSKSKKKIEFTIYQSRKKSSTINDKSYQMKLNGKSRLFRHIDSVYKLPYSCNQSIVIDLIHQKGAKNLNASNISNRGGQFSRENSKDSKASQKSGSFHKKIRASPVSIKNQLKITETLQKLQKFKVVKDYANMLEIESLLKGFILAGEPESKWVLLVIDGVFKKIRNQ